jgi:hypothetical protein
MFTFLLHSECNGKMNNFLSDTNHSYPMLLLQFTSFQYPIRPSVSHRLSGNLPNIPQAAIRRQLEHYAGQVALVFAFLL